MPKLYLLGGENVLRRTARQINMQAFEDAGCHPNVLVFPWARASFDNRYAKRQTLTQYFRSLGAQDVEFVEYGQPDGIAGKLAAADVVYLTGGQPSILLERIRAMQLDGHLRGYGGVIVGRSAGALALCKRCVATVRSNSKARLVKGLGLVDVTMKAHYDPIRDDGVLKRLSEHERIIAVPAGSALVCSSGSLSAIGSVYVYSGGARQAFASTRLGEEAADVDF